MPPKTTKKKKRSKKKGASQSDLQREVSVLRVQLDDVSTKRQADLDTIEQLRDSLAQKDLEISHLNTFLQGERERNTDQLQLVTEEATTRRNLAEHTAQVLGERVRQLQNNEDSHQLILDENAQLRQRLATLLQTMEKESMAYAEETHRLKKESFSLRIQLESTFRKALQEMDGKYKAMAFQEMSQQSKNALIANSKLKEELAIQSTGMQSLLSRYKAQDSTFSKTQVEKSLMENEKQLHVAQLSELKKQERTLALKTSELRQKVATLTAENARLVDVTEQNGQLSSALEESRAQVRKCDAKVQKWKERAFALSDQLMQQSKSTAALPGSTELASISLSPASARRTAPQYLSNTTSSRPATADASLSSSNRNDGSVQAPQTLDIAQPTVEETGGYEDILSIWNSNFPTPVAAGRSPAAIPSPSSFGAGMDSLLRAKVLASAGPHSRSHGSFPAVGTPPRHPHNNPRKPGRRRRGLVKGSVSAATVGRNANRPLSNFAHNRRLRGSSSASRRAAGIVPAPAAAGGGRRDHLAALSPATNSQQIRDRTRVNTPQRYFAP